MSKEDVQKLVQLRGYVMGQYKALGDPSNPAAMIKERDAALVLETVIRSIEDLLGDNVIIQPPKG
jgi:hypothetical protein